MIKNLKLCMWCLLGLTLPALAQDDQVTGKHYWKSGSEFIFSLGDVDAGAVSTSPIMRFSGFFHLQQELHYDFNQSFGFYTGIGIRNVGMINELNDSLKLKQRAYGLGVPVAIKVGNLNGFHVSAGAEAELFFHYKQKLFYDDEKFKQDEWFSDRINLFNPSVFLELNSRKGSYIRFKYYLLDFLVADKQVVKLFGTKYPYFPESSKLFYVSIGTKLIPDKNRRKRGSQNTSAGL
ncbi:MAG: hypothetical protein IPK08_03815 [Bacteroidetes bacterium]|nr:hypothetical protein [Bacteroidota bacterium]